MNTNTQIIGVTTLAIDGMSCGHCVQAVTKALSAVPGVKVRSVEVGSAEIEANDARAAGRAVAALEVTGYPSRASTPAAAKMESPRATGTGCCGGAKSAAPGGQPGGQPGAAGSGGCCGGA